MSDRNDIRRMLLSDPEPSLAAVHYADEGLIDAADLWWLFETHQIVAPRDAWLLVGMWADEIPELMVEYWFGR